MTNIKKCSLCDNELSRFGNIRLADGSMCRKCAALRSTWLTPSDCEAMTTAEMKNHLAYRKENYFKIIEFNFSLEVDGKYSLYIDEDNKVFTISKRKDYVGNNADLFDARDVENISLYEEEYEDSDYVNILFEMTLNNINVPRITFVVNEFEGIEKDGAIYKEALNKAIEYLEALLKICDHIQKED